MVGCVHPKAAESVNPREEVYVRGKLQVKKKKQPQNIIIDSFSLWVQRGQATIIETKKSLASAQCLENCLS